MGSQKQETIEVVAGAGGAKGPGLIGAFRALEEREVAIGKITGVSIGSLVAAFYANGFDSAQLEKLFVEDDLPNQIAREFNSLRSWLDPRPMLGLGVLNMRPAFEQLVQRYGLKPRANLRIVAYNIVTRAPVVFEGTQYNLAEALTASCAIPGIMRPVLYFGARARQQFVTKKAAESMAQPGILVDGGMHHFAPGEFCKGRAIVFKLGMVSRLPRELVHPIEAVFHTLEFTFGRFIGLLQPDSPKDIVVEVGPDDVGGLAFSATPRKAKQMIERGYEAAAQALDRAIALGHVPVMAA